MADPLECKKIQAWGRDALASERQAYEAEGWYATTEPKMTPKAHDGEVSGWWYQQICRKRKFIYDIWPLEHKPWPCKGG